MQEPHSLLLRQLKRAFGQAWPGSGDSRWAKLLDSVSEAYSQSDTDRAMLERALDLSSNELVQANSQLRAVVQAFPDLFFQLDSSGRILDCRAGNASDLCLEARKLIGRRIQDCPDREVGRAFAKALALVDSQPMVVLEYELSPQDQADFYEARLVPLVEKQILCVVRNISDQRAVEAALIDSERDYRGLFDSAHDAILLLSPSQARVLEVNERACRLYGYSRHDFLERSFEDISGEACSGYKTLLGNSAKHTQEAFKTTHTRADGSRMSVEVHASRVLYQGSPAILSINRDVTQREQTKATLESSLSLLEATLDSTADGILVVDRQRRIVKHNQKFQDMWHIPESLLEPASESVVLRHAVQQLEDPQGFISTVEDLYFTPEEETYDLLEFKDGRVFERYSMPQRVGDVIVGRVWSFRDITQRRRAEEKIRHLAYHDELTDLPNRLLFGDRLGQALALAKREKQKLALLFIDIDRFKTINDTLGRAIGDELLRTVSTRLDEVSRKSETIARIGGDEFMMLARDIRALDEAESTAKRVLATFATPFLVGDRTLHLSGSVGISLYPEDGVDAETLVTNADVAVCEAKKRGRNTYRFYQPAMNARALEKLTLENDLRHAIARDELVLHYQPQVCLRTGEIVSTEALVRWRLSDGTLRQPGAFIGLAEVSGLIVPLGAWVLHTACRQAREWLDSGLPPIRLAVNLSARQIGNRDFLGTVEHALSDSGLDPRQLELELTESAIMSDPERGLEVLEALRAMGISVALDDFGTGQSSLSQVTRVPLSTLKIDRSFVHHCADNVANGAIVSSIISMARGLGLRVVAEGVESDEDLAYLREQDCDVVQGFHFSPPVPARVFATLCRRGATSLLPFPVPLESDAEPISIVPTSPDA